MKKLLSVVLGMMSLLAVTALAGDPTAGKELATPCAACHGADGNSPGSAFPIVAGLGEKYLLKQLQDIKSGNRSVPEMAGQLDNLTISNLENLAAYFASQSTQLTGAKKLQVKVNSGEMVDGLKMGERIYRSGNLDTQVPACSGCHSPRGMGNGPAGYPRLSGQYAEYIEKQLHAFRAGERTNDGDARIMRSVAKSMSDAEIKAVANYVAGLN